MDFTNKVVIVTGASSGIGAASATLFASYGASLTLVGRDEGNLQKISSECRSKGAQNLPLALDLTKQGSCEIVIGKTMETYGRIDVLVNCASKILLSSLSDDSMEIFDELMAINVRAPYRLTQLALPHLRISKGCVVNVGSSMSRRWKRGFLPYALSKNALERFSKLAAAELSGEGVRINTISPGITRANLMADLRVSKSCSEYIFKMLKEDFPNGTIVDPAEVAVLICLAASDLFPNMNGSNFSLDGAASMS